MASRLELWRAIRASVEASFPERADRILAGLEDRLDPGPWSVEVTPEETPESRDRVLADVARALRAMDPEGGDAQLRALERWLLDSSVDDLQATLALQEIGLAWNQDVVDWAARALEAGLDSPTLRILAGLGERDDGEFREVLARALRELALALPPDEQRAAVVTRHLCREVLQGRMSERVFVRSMYEAFESLDPHAEAAEIWRTFRYDEADWLDVRRQTGSREVLAAARALIGAPEEVDG